MKTYRLSSRGISLVARNDTDDAKQQSEQPLAGTNRRAFLKWSAAASALPLLLTERDSQAKDSDTSAVTSPKTTPWKEFLPNQMSPLNPVSVLHGADGVQEVAPTPGADAEHGECGRKPHQRYDELGADPTMYEINVVERPWKAHPDLPETRVWSYRAADSTPDSFSPIIFARYGQPVLCRFHCKLPKDHVGVGVPYISVHLHNLHCPSESDGFPGDFFSAHKQGLTLDYKGEYKDHFYPNVYAGLDEMQNGIGDFREALGTLWFHDHTWQATSQNVVRGMFGFYVLFDHLDSGNEKDPSPEALRLPSYPYDYMLSFNDMRFDSKGQLVFDRFSPDGTLGDKILVNGKIEPVLRVARRKYRLRLLNAGPSRFYEFYLNDSKGKAQTFTYIANDGNLLPAPIRNMGKVHLGVAERADLVVDFSKYPIGTELFLTNRLIQETTKGPDKVDGSGTRVLKLLVDRDPPEQDLSQVPDALRPLRPLCDEEIARAKVRRWVFDRKGGEWAVNGKPENILDTSAKIDKGECEIWELVNESGGWQHPVHIHFEEGRILSKTVNGLPVALPEHERGRKDVYVLGKNEAVRVFLRFRDFTGKYVMHCHNVIHEDHGMMLRWDIEDDTPPEPPAGCGAS
ncbi:multicopper oxidase domain-containing protein [Metapseudomonas lalkuanensis]|uniref:Multicopper oxidase CueO n=1 Tax=Metapseudomonas lalkuanensis TaxID=2604832 RepID=A0A5J6QM29_9GAMM|nr:multicopper oxidase domain-containing protein [Pseudomonas lalkuanensis]QEY63584.1 multicopper oxidase domain-containing protein [Pseudomonas lalkuanensis]